MIWIDLDNSPHVPLFRPIVAELQRKGEEVFITSRLHAQTEDLLRLWKIPHATVGTHGGKSKVRKVANLISRARLLRRAVGKRPVTLALSHGSRTQMLAAASLGIRVLVMDDYEYSDQTLARFLATGMLVPKAIPEDRLRKAGVRMDRLMRYDGIKEEIYLPSFAPDPKFRKSIGVSDTMILVTMRPPSILANYHDSRSEELFRKCLEVFGSAVGVLCLIVNRSETERRLIPANLLKSGAARILESAVDGLQLLWASDLVVSGGGTMIREAAILGVPTYSVFTGRRPAVDERLAQMGKLKFVQCSRDIELIPVVARDRTMQCTPADKNLAGAIADIILEFNASGK